MAAEPAQTRKPNGFFPVSENPAGKRQSPDSPGRRMTTKGNRSLPKNFRLPVYHPQLRLPVPKRRLISSAC
jgi:hypothetical protein